MMRVLSACHRAGWGLQRAQDWGVLPAWLCPLHLTLSHIPEPFWGSGSYSCGAAGTQVQTFGPQVRPRLPFSLKWVPIPPP